jgi:hypothetical protein
MADLARRWYRLKLPKLGACAGIVGARIARRTVFFFPGARAHEDHILENGRDAVIRHYHVQDALFRESGIELPGTGIERDQIPPGREQNSRRILPVARPVGDATRRGLSS